jgi:hypothetical protein
MTVGGGIVCISESNNVIHYFGLLNLLYNYDESGEIKWVTRIKDFNFMEIIEKVEESMGPDSPQEFDYMTNVVSLNEHFSLVQVTNATQSTEGRKINQVKTYVINNADGSGYYIKKELPRIISAAGKYLVFYTESDYPGIQVQIAEY